MSMNIPITKPFLDEEEEASVIRTLRSGWISQGPQVKEFEDRFAEYVGSKHAVATTSCTTALHAALTASGIGPGDDVIIPSLSFIATANSVVHAGANPVFADIDPATCNITAATIEKAMTERTKAVMPAHQMGLPVDLDPIIELCGKMGLVLIEDAACAVGSEYKGKKIGGHGNTACFSFHPRKVITTGEGGMITTNDAALAERLRRLRHHGMSVSDIERHHAAEVIIETYPEIGYNYRMTDMQAAMGIAQLGKLPAIIEKRRKIADIYSRTIIAALPHCKVHSVPDYAFHNFQSYWIEVLESSHCSRDMLMQRLLDKGVMTRRGIMAIHREQCYSRKRVSLPQTERITQKTLLLPLYPSMSDEEIEFVVTCLSECLK